MKEWKYKNYKSGKKKITNNKKKVRPIQKLNKDKKSQPIFDPYFILEHYILMQRINVINEIETVHDIDYVKIGKDLLLQNLFIKKLRLDPGFRFIIYSNINKNPAILRKIKREILKFLENSNLFIKSPFLHKNFKEDYNFYENQFKVQIMGDLNFPKVFTSAILASEKKKYWFYSKWREFMNKGEKQKAYATESILLDLITGYDQSYYLFWTTNPYGENRNAYFYLLKALKEIIEKINPFFLDYVDAQRNNILYCEELHDIINNLNFKRLKYDLNEYLDHFQDLVENNINILDKIKIARSFMLIIGIIYFNSLKTEIKLKYLNEFYGINVLFDFFQRNPDFYDYKQYVKDLPIWYKYGFLPEFQPILENDIKKMENQGITIDNNDFLILTKYLIKSLIEQKQFNNALQILFNEFPFLEKFKEKIKNMEDLKKLLDPNSITQIESIFLLGIIGINSNKKSIIKFTIKILALMEEKVLDQNQKIKFKVLMSILYRLLNDFDNERKILINLNINIEKLIKNEEINIFEVMNLLLPAHMLVSEKFHFNRNYSFIQKLNSLEFLETFPLLPINFEWYLIYAYYRKIDLQQNENEFERIINFEWTLIKLINRSLQAQSISSYQKAIKIGTQIEELLFDNNNINFILAKYLKDFKIFEILAFPFFYLKDYDNMIYYLNQALNLTPQNVYYNKYLTILYLFKENYEDASKNIIKIYRQEKISTYTTVHPNLKALFQDIIIWFKEFKFNEIISKLINISQYGAEYIKKLNLIYCDIGLSLADFGYFELALDYFNKALNITNEKKFKASLLNNIGTVYSDMKKLDEAINKFEEAINIDPSDIRFWENLVKMYQFKLDFLKAKEIFEKAREHFKNIDDKKAELMYDNSKLMNKYLRGIINLNKVREKDALSHFNLAQQLIKNKNNIKFSELSNNTGIIFIELTNGFDCCFHST
ncbi:MAG: tetratricopeptide repeat protein, partial [Candidatus Helarchaeota archaeon]